MTRAPYLAALTVAEVREHWRGMVRRLHGLELRDPSETWSVLRRARQVLAAGWAPRESCSAAGAVCDWDDEGLARASTGDALRLGADSFEAAQEAEAFLGGLAAQDVTQWECQPGRTQGDVLRLVERGILRAQHFARGEGHGKRD